MSIPKIRIKNYSEQWIESSFSDVFEILKNNSLSRAELSDNGTVYNIHYGDVLINYEECLNVDKQASIPFIKDQKQGIKLHQSSSLVNGDVVFADAAEDNSVGKCTEIISSDKDAIVAGLHTIPCRPKTNFAPGYLGFFLNSDAFHDQLLGIIQGTKVSSISKKSIKNTVIKYPSCIEEQESISKYMQVTNMLLEKVQEKIDSLNQIKSACLQSMFPQDGESVPKVRFKGFNEEWKEKSADSIFRTFNERNRPDLPVLSATQDKGMVKRESIGYNIFHDISNEATYKHILPGQFVIHLRSFQGGFAHSSIEGIASPAYTVLDFIDKGKQSDLFWKYIFSSKDFIKRLELITYGIRDGRSISFDEFKGMTFLIPSFEEQQKIAAYFENLEKQISLQTQRHEKLKRIKSACLDKMFV